MEDLGETIDQLVNRFACFAHFLLVFPLKFWCIWIP